MATGTFLQVTWNCWPVAVRHQGEWPESWKGSLQPGQHSHTLLCATIPPAGTLSLTQSERKRAQVRSVWKSGSIDAPSRCCKKETWSSPKNGHLPKAAKERRGSNEELSWSWQIMQLWWNNQLRMSKISWTGELPILSLQVFYLILFCTCTNKLNVATNIFGSLLFQGSGFNLHDFLLPILQAQIPDKGWAKNRIANVKNKTLHILLLGTEVFYYCSFRNSVLPGDPTKKLTSSEKTSQTNLIRKAIILFSLTK